MRFVLLATAAWALLSFVHPDAALFLGFVAIMAILMHADRANVKREGLMFIRRTQRGKVLINRVAKSRRLWSAMGYAGIAVGVLAMVLITIWLAFNAYGIVTKQATTGGAGIILPGPVDSPVSAPGLFIIPWWIWLIGITAVVVPHEFMHGVMCRIDKVRIKSVGWAFLLFIPAAFVEPDEAQLNRAKTRTRLNVYAAGSFANLMVAALLLVFLVSVSSVFTQAGTAFPVIEGTPAHAAGLAGHAIVSINGVPIGGVDGVKTVLSRSKSGDTVDILARKIVDMRPVSVFSQGISASQGVLVGEERAFFVTLADNNGTAFLGVLGKGEFPAYVTSLSGEALSVYNVIFWIYVFSIGIGLFNLLPMKPLDGGPFFETLLGKVTKRAAAITRYVSMLMLMLLLINIFGPYVF